MPSCSRSSTGNPPHAVRNDDEGEFGNYDLFVIPITGGLPKRITFHSGYEALCDWSPDGKKIAFWNTDQTRIKEFHLLDQMPLYNTVFKLKYPKAGEQNAIVKIGVADLETGKTTQMDLGEESDIYIPRIFWTNSSEKLAIVRLNRLQNHLNLLIADLNTGKTRAIRSSDCDR